MRRLVAALIAVALVPVLAGCGGGAGGEAAVGTPVTQSSVAASLPPAVEMLDRSAPEDATVFEEFPTGNSVPDLLAQKVEAGQPTLILFVDGAQKVTNEVRSAADKALKTNSGAVDLVLFDLSRYTSVDASGQVVVDAEGLQGDKTASQAVTLARNLKVSGLPYILMTDDQGFIVYRSRGLVDAATLEMHMERLTD